VAKTVHATIHGDAEEDKWESGVFSGSQTMTAKVCQEVERLVLETQGSQSSSPDLGLPAAHAQEQQRLVHLTKATSRSPAFNSGNVTSAAPKTAQACAGPQSFADWTQSQRAGTEIPLAASPARQPANSVRIPVRQQQQQQGIEGASFSMQPMANVINSGGRASSALIDEQFEFGPLPSDLAFSPEAHALRAQQQQVDEQRQQQPDQDCQQLSSTAKAR